MNLYLENIGRKTCRQDKSVFHAGEEKENQEAGP